MHRILINAWRPASWCTSVVRTTIDLQVPGLRQASSLPGRQQQWGICSRDALQSRGTRFCQAVKRKRSQNSSRWFSTTAQIRFQTTPQFQQRLPSRAPSELAFRRNDLRPYEVRVVFGSNAPPLSLANNLLKVLHSRRVNGTLDLDLPKKLTSQLNAYPLAVEHALEWLRREHPIDEDAAILRRIEREEAGEGDEALINRAENLGLYKPQSGQYGAKLGEEGDIFGESVLQKMRKENELKAQQEQEELDEFIEQKQQSTEKAGALEIRKEDGLEVSSGSRPPNLYERWRMQHYINATSKITYEQASQTGKIRRLLPSMLFAAAVAYGSYLFALTWTPPDRATRLMPDEPLSRATILGLISINVGVLLLWKFPPAWRILNRYFITTPSVVRPFSHLGNIFSHQLWGHLGANMFLLYIFGQKLHEQIGRGDFLALYVTSGVIGSVASMTSMVLRNSLYSSSLGASGAVIAVFAAFCTINPDNKITLWLLPEKWQETLSCRSSEFLVFVVAFEVLSMFAPVLRRANIDYVAHLGGYAVGILGGWWWRRENGGRTRGPWGGNRSKERMWYEKILGR